MITEYDVKFQIAGRLFPKYIGLRSCLKISKSNFSYKIVLNSTKKMEFLFDFRLLSKKIEIIFSDIFFIFKKVFLDNLIFKKLVSKLILSYAKFSDSKLLIN